MNGDLLISDFEGKAVAFGKARLGRLLAMNGQWRTLLYMFPYMAARRDDGRQRPPDPESVLLDTWHRAIAALGPERLAIGGKSLGLLLNCKTWVNVLKMVQD